MEQHQAILASIIGDGYLAMPYKSAKNPRFTWNMGHKQHAEYKRDFFSFLGSRLIEKPNGGWGNTHHTVITKSHPLLHDYYLKYANTGNGKNIKGIVDQLNEVGWAWIYGDDGHVGRKTVFIHTEGYGEEGANHYCRALNDFVGGGCAVYSYVGGASKNTRYYSVRMNNEASRRFIQKVTPHMATGMEYKLRLS
jgi:hypothetical protein